MTFTTAWQRSWSFQNMVVLASVNMSGCKSILILNYSPVFLCGKHYQNLECLLKLMYCGGGRGSLSVLCVLALVSMDK